MLRTESWWSVPLVILISYALLGETGFHGQFLVGRRENSSEAWQFMVFCKICWYIPHDAGFLKHEAPIYTKGLISLLWKKSRLFSAYEVISPPCGVIFCDFFSNLAQLPKCKNMRNCSDLHPGKSTSWIQKWRFGRLCPDWVIFRFHVTLAGCINFFVSTEKDADFAGFNLCSQLEPPELELSSWTSFIGTIPPFVEVLRIGKSR